MFRNGVLHDSEVEFRNLRGDTFEPPCDENEWRGNTFKRCNEPCVIQ